MTHFDSSLIGSMIVHEKYSLALVVPAYPHFSENLRRIGVDVTFGFAAQKRNTHINTSLIVEAIQHLGKFVLDWRRKQIAVVHEDRFGDACYFTACYRFLTQLAHVVRLASVFVEKISDFILALFAEPVTDAYAVIHFLRVRPRVLTRLRRLPYDRPFRPQKRARHHPGIFYLCWHPLQSEHSRHSKSRPVTPP